MAKYRVLAQETKGYEIIVEAESIKEAKDKAKETMDWSDWIKWDENEDYYDLDLDVEEVVE